MDPFLGFVAGYCILPKGFDENSDQLPKYLNLLCHVIAPLVSA
jgi:hypothetical protein